MQKILDEAKKLFRENIPASWKDDAVYLKHVEDVRHFASILAKEYGEDVEVAEIAALLHDVGYKYCENGKNHAAKSAELAEDFLSRFDISKEKKDKIVVAIKNHSLKDVGDNISLMDQIIRDADGISFLKNNIEYYYNYDIEEKGEEVAKKETLNKIKRMTEKIKTDLGKSIAQEFVAKARETIMSL